MLTDAQTPFPGNPLAPVKMKTMAVLSLPVRRSKRRRLERGFRALCTSSISKLCESFELLLVLYNICQATNGIRTPDPNPRN